MFRMCGALLTLSCRCCVNTYNVYNVMCASNCVLQVLCNGWGVGTDHYGGYAGEARLQSAWAIPLPAGHIGAPRAQVESIRALRLMSPYFSRAERRAGSTDRHGRLHRHALRGRSGEEPVHCLLLSVEPVSTEALTCRCGRGWSRGRGRCWCRARRAGWAAWPRCCSHTSDTPSLPSPARPAPRRTSSSG